MKSISAMSADLTVLMVAHRLSTLVSCNRIVELHDGSVKRILSPKDLHSLKHSILSMKAVILAGGLGTRISEETHSSRQW